MAKQLGTFELVIRGDASAPTQMFRRYAVEESTDTTLRKNQDTLVETPAFDKTLHDAGSVGELWRDEVDAAKTAEGIS